MASALDRAEAIRRFDNCKIGKREMSFGFEQRLRYWQEQYGDQLLTVITILLLLLLFVVAPFQAAGMIDFQILGILILLGILGSALLISGSPTAFVVMLVAFGMNAMAVIHRLQQQSTFDLYLVAGSWLIFSVTLGWVVARAVFGLGRITYHRIAGAVLLYLLISVTFVALYIFVGLFAPKAFTGLTLEDNTALASNLIYFSFTTLTSTGYGDIVPVHPVARSLCNLETIIGQLYPATLLARLVTLELEDRRSSKRK